MTFDLQNLIAKAKNFRNFGSNLNNSSFLSPDYTNAFNSMGKAIATQLPIYGSGLYSLYKFLPQNINMASNPTGYVNNIESDYMTSPYSEYQQQKLNQYANAQAAAAGNLGTPDAQYDLAKEEQGLISKDQQQFFNNVNDILKEGLSGEKYVTGLGDNAADRISSAFNVIAALQAAQANEGEASLGDILGSLAGLAAPFAKQGAKDLFS